MIVFPIGHYVGSRHASGNHLVRVGMSHRRLTGDEFRVWMLAHGRGRGAWTIPQVLALAADSSLAAASSAVDRLLDAGMLVNASPRSFAESYRLRPLLVGLGDYRVGLPGLPPVAELASGAYELWQWAALAPSLWHMHTVRGNVAAESLDALLDEVRELLVNGCAYLDVAP